VHGAYIFSPPSAEQTRAGRPFHPCLCAPTPVNTSTYLSCSHRPQRGNARARRPRGQGPAPRAGRGSEGPRPLPAPPRARRPAAMLPHGPAARRPNGAAPLPLAQQRCAAGPREGKGKEGSRGQGRARTCRAGAGAPAAAQGEVEAGRGAQHSPAGSGGAKRGSLPRPTGGGRAARAAADPHCRGDPVRNGAAIFPPRHSNPSTAPRGGGRAARREGARAGPPRRQGTEGTGGEQRRGQAASPAGVNGSARQNNLFRVQKSGNTFTSPQRREYQRQFRENSEAPAQGKPLPTACRRSTKQHGTHG